jgi:hypothetical protein
MPYTLGQAAKATGKSKPTILQAIQSNRLEAKKDDLNRWQIEEEALFRLYPKLTEDNPEALPEEKPHDPNTLQAVIDGLRELLRQIEGERDDLRRRLDDDAAERHKLQEQCLRLSLITSRVLEDKREAERQLEDHRQQALRQLSAPVPAQEAPEPEPAPLQPTSPKAQFLSFYAPWWAWAALVAAGTAAAASWWVYGRAP